MAAQSFNRIRIDRSALRHNYRTIAAAAGEGRPLMAMVKADGYGHGMEEAAQAFAAAGCTRFGVAEMEEGVVLRKSGIGGEILVTMGFPLDGVEQLFRHRLTPVIYSLEQARAIGAQAELAGCSMGVHIKLDTGMGRLGILPAELIPLVEQLATVRGIEIHGLMSHFPAADDPSSPTTMEAMGRFDPACAAIKERFAGICHIANSGGVLNFPATRCDMVRAGIALYGYHPAGGGRESTVRDLRPAMSYTTRILQVKKLPAGYGISYGHTCRLQRPTTVAVLPIGYEDGFSRAFSNCGEVLVRGQRAAVLGRVCMNMSMVDVSSIAGVRAGEEVVVLGRQLGGAIDADEMAEKIGTISYEILCMLGNNNHREYTE